MSMQVGGYFVRRIRRGNAEYWYAFQYVRMGDVRGERLIGLVKVVPLSPAYQTRTSTLAKIASSPLKKFPELLKEVES